MIGTCKKLWSQMISEKIKSTTTKVYVKDKKNSISNNKERKKERKWGREKEKEKRKKEDKITIEKKGKEWIIKPWISGEKRKEKGGKWRD